jgi:IS30 family transposase
VGLLIPADRGAKRCRELRLHLKPHDRQVYDADRAHALAPDNARRERAGLLVRDAELRELVKAKLQDTRSPQQTSAWLRTEHPTARSGTSATRRSTKRCISAATAA